MSGRRSAAIGVWLANGSRHEAPLQGGYAHLMEHMLFKGSEDYDALTLARRFEAIGGQINAHTGRELTALHGTLPAENLLELTGMFLSMLLKPCFDKQDLDTERTVVLQEIAMLESDPETLLEEDAVARAWPGHAMGNFVLGLRKTLRGASQAALRRYWHDQLAGGRIWVVAAGNVDHAALHGACAPLQYLPAGGLPALTPPTFSGGSYHERGVVPQSQLLWIMPAPPLATPHTAQLTVANHILGGGVSSRLFLEIRERLGMAYSVHSRLEQYSDCGLWLIQTQCDPDITAACRQAVEHVVEQLIADGPDDEELKIARGRLHAELALEDDDPDSCMERLARDVIYLQRHPTFEERSDELEAVTPCHVQHVLRTAWAQRLYVEATPKSATRRKKTTTTR